MAIPRFDRDEMIRYMGRQPIEGFNFAINHDGKEYIITGSHLKQYMLKLEYFEVTKIVENWYWSNFYGIPIEQYLFKLAHSLVVNGDLMSGIHDFELERKELND
jgi:hypothetical protein